MYDVKFVYGKSDKITMAEEKKKKVVALLSGGLE